MAFEQLAKTGQTERPPNRQQPKWLGLGTGTVRNQLKRAMQKTGTKSQTQLTLAVVRGSGSV
jgi:hypothetical protein